MNIQDSLLQGSSLRKGLFALSEAYGRKTDEETVRLWAKATRELTEEQWKHGIDVIVRSPRQFFPSPGIVIEAAYTAPPPARVLPKIRECEGVWESPGQAAYVTRIVRENPKGQTEPVFTYLRRIAVLSGLVDPEDDEPETRVLSVSKADQEDSDGRY